MHSYAHATCAQMSSVMHFPPVREFLSIDNPRAAVPIYDQEPIDEPMEVGGAGAKEDHLDLCGTEKEAAAITDFDLLKVIGKGSFGKVRPLSHE